MEKFLNSKRGYYQTAFIGQINDAVIKSNHNEHFRSLKRKIYNRRGNSGVLILKFTTRLNCPSFSKLARTSSMNYSHELLSRTTSLVALHYISHAPAKTDLSIYLFRSSSLARLVLDSIDDLQAGVVDETVLISWLSICKQTDT